MWIFIVLAILILAATMASDKFKASEKVAQFVIEKWRPLVAQYQRYYPNVPVSTALAVIAYESRGDSTAVNPEKDKEGQYDDSVGLFQITDGVVQDWNASHSSKRYTFADLTTPYVNVEIGLWNLSRHEAHFKDMDKAVRAHNGGRGGINLAMTAIYLGRVKQYEALISKILK